MKAGIMQCDECSNINNIQGRAMEDAQCLHTHSGSWPQNWSPVEKMIFLQNLFSTTNTWPYRNAASAPCWGPPVTRSPFWIYISLHVLFQIERADGCLAACCFWSSIITQTLLWLTWHFTAVNKRSWLHPWGKQFNKQRVNSSGKI